MDTAEALQAAFSLDGKVAVVTGAGSGLGRETARVFQAAGAFVVLSDLNEAGMAQTLASMDSKRTIRVRADVASRADMEALADRAFDGAGGLDHWFHAAGIGYMHALLDTDRERAERVFAVNALGAYWATAAAGRVMANHGGGSITLVSSSGGLAAAPGVSIYGMSKAAIHSLTWSAAAELGPMGIRVNAIAPGWIATPMSFDMFRDESGAIDPARKEAVMAQLVGRSPIGMTGEPPDIAYAALYLATEAGRFMTGQVLGVNGGTASMR
jgi:3-oxoacyl-[acyl-carrier protein] reductase